MQVLLHNKEPYEIDAGWKKRLKVLGDYLEEKYSHLKGLTLDIRVRRDDKYVFSLEVTADSISGGFRPRVWSLCWQMTQTPSCCAFPLLHTFSGTDTDESLYPTMAWIVQTLNALYWEDESLGRNLESWEMELDDYDEGELQHCMQLNLVGHSYPFWHWFAKEFGTPEGSFKVFNHNSGNEVEVVVSRFS